MPRHSIPFTPAAKKKLLLRHAEIFFFAQQLQKKYTRKPAQKILQRSLPVSLNQEIYQGVTVMLSAAEWLVPEVAVTVMLEVPGGVPFCGFVFGLPPPPQLTTRRARVMIPKTAEQCLAFLPR